MRRPFRSAALAVAALLLMAARAEPILPVTHQPVPPVVTQKLHGNAYARLYADAAIQKGWRPLPTAPGQIRASLTIRGTHSLTVDILYDAASYSIVVVSSEALNQSEGRIHPAANQAIRALRDTIDAAMSRAAF